MLDSLPHEIVQIQINFISDPCLFSFKVYKFSKVIDQNVKKEIKIMNKAQRMKDSSKSYCS